MWSDEEIVFFIRDYGSKKWVMYSLMALLGFLLLLNYKMWRRLQRTRTENEVHVEWTDAEDELEVRLSLPAAVTASDIRVEVQPASLKVFMKMGAKRKWEAKPLMEGKLFKLIKSSETTWYVEDRVLKILLTKQLEKHWKRLWEGTEELVKKDK